MQSWTQIIRKTQGVQLSPPSIFNLARWDFWTSGCEMWISTDIENISMSCDILQLWMCKLTIFYTEPQLQRERKYICYHVTFCNSVFSEFSSGCAIWQLAPCLLLCFRIEQEDATGGKYYLHIRRRRSIVKSTQYSHVWSCCEVMLCFRIEHHLNTRTRSTQWEAAGE